jgi:hypothetical protein
MNRIILFILCLLLPLKIVAQVPKGVSARDFGAKGDSAADDTSAIQKALDAVAAGGGVVSLPAGAYRITNSLVVPQGVTLLGEGARWENAATKLIVEKPGFVAVKLGHMSAVKGLAISYPNNSDNANPTPYPPAIEVGGINPSVENIVFDCAWIGVSTPPGGANAGQGMFRDLTGFVHHMGMHLSGCRDVNRILDVHWFVGGKDTAGKESYYRKNRVGFEFGDVDGILMDRCFIIGGKTFFQQLLHKDAPDAKKEITHSLGYHIDNCWIEDVDNGFIFDGMAGFVIKSSNILVRENGVGVKVSSHGLFYNAVVESVQVRGFGKTHVGFDYEIRNPHPRNRLVISNCQVTDGAPSVHLRSGSRRAQIHGCHLTGLNGSPAILIDKGADLFTITDNILNGRIEDNSATEKKTMTGNVQEGEAPRAGRKGT